MVFDDSRRESLLKRWKALEQSIVADSDHEYNLEWGRLRETFYEENGPIPCSSADMERLSTLKDAFKGERIFILGNGPSLNHTPLELLKDEFTFVTNRIYLLFDRIDWRPAFYTATDWRVVPDIAHEINLLTGMIFFFEERFRGLLRGDDEDIYWYTHMSAVSPAESKFAYDLTDGCRGCGSVTGSAIQIAFYMGFSPIYLIGCDLGYKVGETVKQEGPDKSDEFGTATKLYLTSTEDDDFSHFDNRYFGKDRRWHGPNMKRMMEGHIQCKDDVEKAGGSIFNATVGGELEVYERVDFSSLFPRPRHVAGKQLLHELRKPIEGIFPITEPSIESCLLGPFSRAEHAGFSENDLILGLLADRAKGSVMVDVGAQVGSCLSSFLQKGWRVHAFEPDPRNREHLKARFGERPNLTIDDRAVSDRTARGLPFYISAESAGISSLHAFHEGHKETCTVSTTTIADYVREKDLHSMDYLKIDTEGYDFLVLKGVPWASIKPNVVMCEFEDRKTRSLGYTMHDMARYLTDHGYTVMVSEWHPIVRYGMKHDWRRLVRYPCELETPDAWGNLIAFLEDPGDERLRSLARQTLEFSPTGRSELGHRHPGLPYRLAERVIWRYPGLAAYVVRRHPRIAEIYRQMRDRGILAHLRANYPTLMHLARFAGWSLAVLKRTFFGIGGIALLVVAGLFVAGALVAAPLRWYLIGIAGALLLLCGGVLALSYARSLLSQSFAEQRKQIAANSKAMADVDRQVAGVNKQVSGLSKQVSDNKNTLANTNVGNFPRFQQFNRRLTEADLRRFAGEWAPKLGLDLNARALAYIAHRICLAEDTCLGRLAGNIETMLLRVLVARSVKERNLEVLEIGTLFGIGVAMIHENCRGFSDNTHVTVIDPLSGYYGEDQVDVMTGTPVTRSVFALNMHRMSVPESDYTIIEKLSTEDEALEQASRRRYNLLIIDGDHSDSGVRHDFFSYRHLVKRGGYIIFDDYGNPSWPDIKAFVNKEVVGLPQLEFVGTDVNIAVFRVIAPPDSTDREPG